MAGENEDEQLSMGDLSTEEIEALRDAGEWGDERTPGSEEEEALQAVVGEVEGEEVDDDPLKILAKDEPPPAKKDDPPKVDEPATVATADEDDEPFLADFRPDPERIKVIDTELAQITTDRDALRKQLSDGDIDQDSYIAKADELSDKRADLQAEKTGLVRDEQRTAEQYEQLWQRDQARFWSRPDNAIFKEDADPILFQALNTQLKLLHAKAEADGTPKSGRTLLAEAAAAIRTKFNLPGAAAAKPDDAEARRKAAATRAKAQSDAQAKAPKTLTDIPNADGDDEIRADKWDDIDRMLASDDPETQFEAEMLIARMDDGQRRSFGTVKH